MSETNINIKFSFTTDPLTAQLRNVLLKDQPTYALALSPDRNMTNAYFRTLEYYYKHRNAANNVIKGLPGTGKSNAGIVSCEYLRNCSGMDFDIDNVFYSVSDILKKAGSFEKGHILLLDEWRGITNVGEGGMTETQELLDLEGITREEQINFFHCSNLLPKTTLQKCKHLIDMFDIDYEHHVSRGLILSKQIFNYPAGHCLFPDIEHESMKLITVDGRPLKPRPEFYLRYLTKKRDYMASVRKRSGLGKFETHIEAALDCVNDPNFLLFEKKMKPRMADLAKRNFISAKFQHYPISVKKRIYQLTLVESVTPGYLQSLMGVMKKDTKEAIQAQILENEIIANQEVTKEDINIELEVAEEGEEFL